MKCCGRADSLARNTDPWRRQSIGIRIAMSERTQDESRRRLLVICDYGHGLIESLCETLTYAGFRDCVLVRKRRHVWSPDARIRVISVPLRVVGEEEPIGIGSIMSVMAYLIVTTFVGAIMVVRHRLDTVMGVFAFPQGLAALLIGEITHRKVVILTDGGDIDVLLRKALIRAIVLICLRRATLVTALNDSKKNQLLSLDVHAHTCPTIGVDASHFEYVPLGEKERHSLLYVGRLSREKCPGILIKALNRLRQRGVCFEALVVGDGPLRNEIDDTTLSIGMESLVGMKGYVPHSEIYHFFKRSPIFVLPSTREGVSVSLMEAMSSGCLCIVSDIPDNREVIKNMHNGITFRASDEEDLADKLEWAIEQLPKLQFMTANARHLVERSYSVEAIGSGLRSILSKLDVDRTGSLAKRDLS